jgi:CRISPR-associated endonuclease Cas2
MSQQRLFTGLYDVHDERIRRVVRQLLSGYGVRSEYSVFDCWLDAPMRARLLAQLSDVLDPTTDCMALARVMDQHRIGYFGDTQPVKDGHFFYIG